MAANAAWPLKGAWWLWQAGSQAGFLKWLPKMSLLNLSTCQHSGISLLGSRYMICLSSFQEKEIILD